ncbi:MAG: hypothetical protein ACERKZ_16400 [Lachnotalea sp.]
MGLSKKLLSTEERISLTKRIALSYYGAYQKKAVKEGATYDDWKFAKGATYWSPYFGNEMIDLETNPISVEDSATMEALSYSVEFPDWAPLNFEFWPAAEGVAWKSNFGGHSKTTGELKSFFAYSYININEFGEITHWETHVNVDYDKFLDEAIGEHGPYIGAQDYMVAVTKKLQTAGIDLFAFKH